ncbi:MAG TPA: hypothetical protein VFA69_00710 [Candidatus Nitrosotalea sp.]|nr:hypothetical protein [Candidatus Nitrosotalea sp.]
MTEPPFHFGVESSAIFTITHIAVIAIAIILMAISITAYKNTSLKRIKYVICAFGLFAFNYFINLIDAEYVDIIPDDMRYALTSSGALGILILLFVGIVKK